MLLNLKSATSTPLTDADIPASIARDAEVTAAVAAHAEATDPHPIYLTQPEGDSRYRQTGVTLADTDIPASIARDAEVAAAVTAHSSAPDPHPVYLTQSELPLTFPTSSLYGSIGIPGTKNDYAGINFSSGFDSPVFMVNSSKHLSGMWSIGSTYGWLWWYNKGQFLLFDPYPIAPADRRGSFIGLDKSTGSLPGYPNQNYPVVKTDYGALYFSVAGVFSSYIDANGTYTSVSSRHRKENAVELDYADILKKIKRIPIYEYNFLGDTRTRRFGCYAQDFYEQFKLGGDEDIDADESPTKPSEMISLADSIGACLAAVKALDTRLEVLESKLIGQ